MNLAYAPQKAAPSHARPSMPVKQPSDRYAMVDPSHPVWMGYILWIFGFLGAHRFYYGKPISGSIWFLTVGLFLVGWIIDLFLIPAMAEQANQRYQRGRIDYTVAWILHLVVPLGLFGLHRFYMGKILTGLLWLCTGGLLGIGYIYDTLTLNEQIDELNSR